MNSRFTACSGFALLIALGTGSICLTLPGCGASETKKSNDFFTSGDREADQRADQRMAKDQQIKDTKAGNSILASSDAKKSLYDRLGGTSGIAMIVDDFVPRALADPRVNWYRKGVKQGGFSIHRNRSETWNPTPDDIKSLKLHLTQFMALATGGPSEYQGREMRDSHAGMHISNSEFDATIGDLKASLDKLQIAQKEQKELLAVIETTRTQIVEQR
jgi:hemoglobin